MKGNNNIWKGMEGLYVRVLWKDACMQDGWNLKEELVDGLTLVESFGKVTKVDAAGESIVVTPHVTLDERPELSGSLCIPTASIQKVETVEWKPVFVATKAKMECGCQESGDCKEKAYCVEVHHIKFE